MSHATKKVILLNGPAGCGKDTAALAIRGLLNGGSATGYSQHDKMAEPLKKGVHALFGLFFDPAYYDEPINRDEKDKGLARLFGMSPREAYIWMSEECVKPRFGKDAFGKMMVHRMKTAKTVTCHVISDAGFVEELLPVVDYVGEENTLVLEIHANRDGTRLTFDGDSRSYIGDILRAFRPAVTVRSIYNDIEDHESKEFYRMIVLGAVKKFLEIG